MLAITGICDFCASTGSALASSWVGTATRTISQPEAVNSAICCKVASMSVVCVVVIDCTETGWSEPTMSEPTLTCRVLRRGAKTGGGSFGMSQATELLTGPIIPFHRSYSHVDCW